MPYQCGTGPTEQDPDEVDVSVIEIEDSDVVIVYSDGFDDNVYADGIPDCIEQYMEDGIVTSLSSAADCLAREAHILGKDMTYFSPF